jgi:hypothetical protein
MDEYGEHKAPIRREKDGQEENVVLIPHSACPGVLATAGAIRLRPAFTSATKARP